MRRQSARVFLHHQLSDFFSFSTHCVSAEENVSNISPHDYHLNFLCDKHVWYLFRELLIYVSKSSPVCVVPIDLFLFASSSSSSAAHYNEITHNATLLAIVGPRII